MIKKELAKNDELANENWDRFLPKFKAANQKKRKKKQIEEKEYNPFPPTQQPRKEDLLMESGEYFMTQKQKNIKKEQQDQEKRIEKQKIKENKRKEDNTGMTIQSEIEKTQKKVKQEVDQLKQQFMKGSKLQK